ncbi:TIGR02530 family flagellar biosynthesis protein [Proteiniclasticum sp. C24MP]|uniref:TIGR02530 family flagellar biosynthesis protein n=1 Tax=Proteiniclasticum sp. C24MP TaxID=3374101 RepID=UPI0037545FA4
MSFKIQNGQIIPSQGNHGKVERKPGGDFERLYLESLKKTKETVKLSAHAQERMEKRQITLSEEDMVKINDAVDTLEKKGARESLLLYKDAAFIASIRNKTIITAMRNEEMETITNIDSAVSIR